MSDYQGPERRSSDRNLAAHAEVVSEMKAEMRGMRSDFVEIKESLRDLAQSMGKLVLVEERQTQMTAALDRAFVAIRDGETRLRALEISSTAGSRAADWIERAMFAALGILGAAIGKALHFF